VIEISDKFTLGSLFDGIGGFPLAAERCGIEPRWASEIEAFPISVTKRHFPNMTHLGDVTKIDGAKIEPVDIITFGSPCQDLSVAKHDREGLEGERSSLFYEAVRIIEEMRRATNGRYPRFAKWENVPGALSSNKGEDFRSVIEALARVVDPTVAVPRSTKWATAGVVVGNGWSIAWRILDARYFGDPQRRRRIFVVADFGGKRARDVLFECEGMSRDSATSGKARTNAPDDASAGVGGDGFPRLAGTLLSSGAGLNRPAGCASEIDFLVPTVVDALTARLGSAGPDDNAAQAGWSVPTRTIPDVSDEPVAIQYSVIAPDDANGPAGPGYRQDGTMYTLDARGEAHAVAYRRLDFGRFVDDGTSSTLSAREYKSPTDVVVHAIDVRNLRETSESGTLQAKSTGGYSLNYVNPIRIDVRVRRLTPTECERLQGYPDGWTAGGSDSKRYKALGNSVNVSCVTWIMRRLKRVLDEE
jgi:DNA (cytosine-5)-methyltransferase 1